MSDVEGAGLGDIIEDMVDGAKRGWDAAKDGVGREADRLREKYAAERRERMLRLALLGLVVYLTWSD